MVSIKINSNNLPQKIRFASVLLVCIVYSILFFGGNNFIDTSSKIEQEKIDESVFKLVNIQEYIPPVSKQVPEIKQKEVQKKTETVVNNTLASEKIIETENKVEEVVYLPQNKISKVPVIPAKKVLSRIEYPSAAKKQGIEGVVYLELFIDEKGKIRKIDVLKDPGHGFADAAIKALYGITVVPAVINDKPCAVRYRYPVRFSLK